MPVRVLQWCAGVLLVYYCSHPVISKISYTNYIPKEISVTDYLYFLFCSRILLTHGDGETNPRPKKLSSHFSCCHLNVNGLIAQNTLRVFLL